jgi:hypothetical protein
MGSLNLRLKITALFLFLISSAKISRADGFSYDESPRHIRPVPIPGATTGIGFDDMNFSPFLKKMLVPGGRMGDLFLVTPKTHDVSEIGGFSVHLQYYGGHRDGVTSADSNKRFLFATDRTSMKLSLIDPQSKKIIAAVPLAAEPDYVRYISLNDEIWVTEPQNRQIEVFSFKPRKDPPFKRLRFISVENGPESLVIDEKTKKAFANSTSSETMVIDLKSKEVLARWPNRCLHARGLALDLKKQFLFVGCAEGKVETLDIAHNGKILGEARSGQGVDIIAYNPLLSHLYMSGANSGTMAVVHVLGNGRLYVEEAMPTAHGAHCVAVDNNDGVWICDPRRGRLLFFQDLHTPIE